eukprot:6563775-Ditylum_brightwellii.AAC.1
MLVVMCTLRTTCFFSTLGAASFFSTLRDGYCRFLLFWSLFLVAVSSSKIPAISLIALSWASPTGANGAP